MHIFINGKKISTQHSTVKEVADWYRKENKFSLEERFHTIVDGFQTEENFLLEEGMELVFLQPGKVPSKESLECLMRARHTPHIYEKLKKARVAVAGLGGLGSNIAVMLGRMGVGHLNLVDFDTVEPTNLNRQQYFIRHLGMLKTEALREELLEINPYIEVEIHTVKVTRQNAVELFQQDDIICEAFDSPREKAMFADVVLTEMPQKILIASSGMAGVESCNKIHTRKISEEFYLCGDGQTEARPGQGLMAPRVMVCAGHQANMLIRKIIGENDE